MWPYILCMKGFNGGGQKEEAEKYTTDAVNYYEVGKK